MSKIQVYKIGQRANCKIYGCREPARIAVGDPRFDRDSMYLCDSHAFEIYRKLAKVYGVYKGDDEGHVCTREDFREALLHIFTNTKNERIRKEDVAIIGEKLGLEFEEEETRKKIVEKLVETLKEGE